jgi:hypothetical protein
MKPISIRMDKDLLKVIDRIVRLQGITPEEYIQNYVCKNCLKREKEVWL